MKILYKQLLGFLIIVVIISAGGFMAVNEIEKAYKQDLMEAALSLTSKQMDDLNRDIYNEIEGFVEYTTNNQLQRTVSDSNLEFERFSNVQGYIDDKDRKWKAAPSEEITPFMQNILNNELSRLLSNRIRFYEEIYSHKVYGEVFITNKYGANIAQTGKTSDYRQDDEGWWQSAKTDGFYVKKEISYDESSGVYSMDIGIRINDAAGRFAGVMKLVLNIEHIIESIKKLEADEQYNKFDFKLINRNGKIIYSSEGDKFLSDISDKQFFRAVKEDAGYFILQGDKAGEKDELYVYARSKGHEDSRSLGWILLLEYDTEEIFAPIIKIHKWRTVLFTIIILFSTFVSFLIARAIAKPVERLRNAATAIGAGKRGILVEVKTRDEIGDLTVAFNQMTKELQQAIGSRDIEIVERKQAEDQLRIFRQFAEASSQGFAMASLDGKIRYINTAFCNLLGEMRPEDVQGKHLAECYPEELRPKVLETVIPSIMKDGHWEGEMAAFSKNGERIPTYEHIFLIRDDEGKPLYTAGIIIDHTERKRWEEELTRLATTDRLTGTYNRTKFIEVMPVEIARAKRYNRLLSLSIFDIDHFKKVNDTFGHSAGDDVLKIIADIARKNMRATSYLFRWGGEEFVILVPETASHGAGIQAEHIRKAIESYEFDAVGKVTVSFGVTQFREDDTVDTLLSRADSALYRAKSSGRNRVEVVT